MNNDLPLDRLLRDIASGGAPQNAAINQLYAAYRKPYLCFFLRRGVDAAQAEDLLQDVLVLIVRKASSFRADTAASAVSWLWTIARNRLMDHLRSARPGVFSNDDALADIPDTSPSLQHAFQAQALDDCVLAALKNFAQAYPERADAIRLAELEGWSIAQLAEYLGRTVGATREFLSQCRKHFKAFLEPCRPLMASHEENA